MDNDVLLICREEDDVPDGTSAVVISQEIKRIDPTEANELYARLVALDVDHGFDLPVYSLLSNQIWSADRFHDDAPGALDLLIPLYHRLSSHVDAETERIRCVGVSDLYLDLVEDLAHNEGLELEHDAVDSDRLSYTRVGRTLLWLCFSVIDILVSVVAKSVYQPSGADVLIKYPAFRPDTFRPIEERLDIPFDATFTLLTVSFFRHAQSITKPETNVVPLRVFDTPSGMIRDYPEVVHIIWDIIMGDRTVSATAEAIEAETDVRIEAVTRTITGRVVMENPSALLYHGTADRLFNSGQYSCVLVTSLGPSGKLLTHPANNHGVHTLNLGHSITFLPGAANRHSLDAVFVEGTIARRLVDDELGNKFVPTGLPKHMNIVEQASGTRSSHEQRMLLIGTQSFDNRYRSGLITDVVPGVLEETNWRVVLKLHPGESAEFYEELLRSIGYNPSNNDRISVATDDLYGYIHRADLLLTVNSNVGIESIILGTPAVCYNPWVPSKRDPPYASHGPVPKFEVPSDLVNFLMDYDPDRHRNLQQPLITGPYDVVGNSLDKIAARVETELSNRTESDSRPNSGN